MIAFIYETLCSFRGVFSRSVTWLLFCMVVLGFLGADQLIGISSFCRFWGLGESGYHALLHFFRSQAWSMDVLLLQWGAFVLSQDVAVKVGKRAVMLGDHTLVPKDGRKMPGVVTLHQESETQTKPSYFRGHCWGAIGLLIGSLAASFCMPLALSIHQGLVHIGLGSNTEDGKDTLGTRVVQMAVRFAMAHDLPCVLILDAFFPCAAVFNLAASVWSTAIREPLVTLIIKAKSNYVAYFEPLEPERRGPGRPPKYGEKVHLMELFDHRHTFSKATCHVYGKLEEISIMAVNLLWEPTDCLIRFVLAITSRGPIVLMCSDLGQDPVLAVELYCSRIRIEVMFDMLKNLIFAFCYRFWSKLLPRHSRRPKRNKKLMGPSSQSLPVVHRCWDAYERFVSLGAISLGLLQLLALKFTDSVWCQFGAFMRTRSRLLPSERTVKSVVAGLLLKDLSSFAPHAILREILSRFVRKERPPVKTSSSIGSDVRSALG